MSELFANDVYTTLASSVAPGAGTVSLTSAAGLPAMATGDWMRARIEPATPDGTYELVLVTARSGTTLTVSRNQEGTSAPGTWAFGDRVTFVTTAQSLRDLGAGVSFNVRNYGAIGDGDVTSATAGTDSRAGINAAIDAATASGGGVVDGGGDVYVVKSSPGIVLKAGVTLTNMTIVQGYWPGQFVGLIQATGTYTNTNVTGAVMSGDVAANIKVLTMTSTANLVAGRFYLLGADRAYVNAAASSSNDQNRYRGEIVQVLTVDSATQVTLVGVTHDDYAVADAASLHAITFLDGARINNVRVVNPEPNTTHVSDLIKFSYCRNVAVDDVVLDGGDGVGVHLDMCLDSSITGGTIQNLTDNAGALRFGYGVLANRATQNLRVTGVAFRKVRHGFTTNGVDFMRGVPRNVVVSACTAQDTTQDSFDTHVQGAQIIFSGCVATGAQNISAFQIRSPDTHVVGCYASYCGQLASFIVSAHGSSVRGSALRHSNTYAGSTGAVFISKAKQVEVVNNTIYGAYVNAVRLDLDCNNATIENNRIVNNGWASGNPGIFAASTCTATGVRIIGNDFSSLTVTTEEAKSIGQLTYPIDLGTATISGWHIRDNVSTGATQAVFINGSLTTHVVRNNGQLNRFNGSDNLWFAGALPASDALLANGEASVWWDSTVGRNVRAIRIRGKDTAGTVYQPNLVDAENGGKESVEIASSLSTGNKTITLSNGNVFDYTLAANTTFAISGATSGFACSITVILHQDATGSRTATWPASVRWGAAGVPTLTTTANAVDVVSFLTTDGGTTWYGFLGGKAF